MFIRLLKYIYFDPASPHNPNSHMLVYLRSLVTRYLLTLLKPSLNNSTTNKLDSKRLELAYSTLTYCESLVKSVYRMINSSSGGLLFMCGDSIRTQKSLQQSGLDGTANNNSNMTRQPPTVGGGVSSLIGIVAEAHGQVEAPSQALETDSLEKEQREKDALLVRQRRVETIQFGDLIFENVIKIKNFNNL